MAAQGGGGAPRWREPFCWGLGGSSGGREPSRHGGAGCLVRGAAGRRAGARATRSTTLMDPPPLPSPSSPSSGSSSGSIGGRLSLSPGGAPSSMGLRGGLVASRASSSTPFPSVESRSTWWVQLDSPSGFSPAGSSLPSDQWRSAAVSEVGQSGPSKSAGMSGDTVGSSTGFASLVQYSPGSSAQCRTPQAENYSMISARAACACCDATTTTIDTVSGANRTAR